ncbi:MAG: single-stranded-DNA-specific exonuclease RecJ [Ponticaulis sp.]|nr:single-stranded-DNA-specific exonuclease RecJ [Ponticaulis sp.]|tara:strand:- start:1810 stop:3561 length:1752 start_codon:yes stop_codon:yes gene_type:complete
MTSARGLVWLEPNISSEMVSDFARQTGQTEPVSALLLRQHVKPDEVEHFLNPTLKHFFPDPSTFKDMNNAAGFLADAIQSGKSVAVLADYDVDGATSAAQLIRYFRHFDRSLELYVPDRLKEGYGPSPHAFEVLKSQGVEIVVTVDCGAAAETALNHATDIGLDIIVVDHHLMGEDIPVCSALVNPNRPDCDSGQGHLAAAGVVFVLLVAINRHLRESGQFTEAELPNLMHWLDLCSLGTLCDMVPLRGVNRAFVVQGLKTFAQQESAGISALCQVSGRSTPERINDLTFGLGPQLNAGGRIGDPWLATELLASTKFEKALPIAEKLHGLNEARKEIEADILSQARLMAKQQLESKPDLPVIVVGGEGWHPGVIGIVAGRLKDEFLVPSIVIGWGDAFGDVAKGSARSVTGINIGSAIVSAREAGLLLSGGGHAMAGGLSLEPDQIGAFRAYLEAHITDLDVNAEDARTVQIDFDVLASALSLDFLTILEKAGPYGAAAPKPLLRIKSARVRDRRLIGTNHMKVTLDDGSARLECVAWRSAETPLWDACAPGAEIDVIGHAERNAWRGRDSVQFEIVDCVAKN